MKVFARCNCAIGIGKSKLHLILHLVSKKKKKKGLFGDTLSLTTSHLLLLDVTPVKNIKNTEMAIKILKNGKKILKAPSQGWRHWKPKCWLRAQCGYTIIVDSFNRGIRVDNLCPWVFRNKSTKTFN